jgi:hypothetical protein
MNKQETNQSVVLGQKYAFATASLVLGIASFVNLLGMEKAILALVFGWLALKQQPAPALGDRRAWAKTGVVLGALILIIVPVLLIAFFDHIRELIDVLEKFGGSR